MCESFPKETEEMQSLELEEEEGRKGRREEGKEIARSRTRKKESREN